MKFSGIQRSVRVQRIDRSVGDAPSLGRVARIPGTGLPKARRRKKRRENVHGERTRSNRRKVIVTWSVVIMVAALGAIGGAVYFWLVPKMQHSAAALTDSKTIERVVSRFESPSEEAAVALVKGALTIADPAMVEEFFHLGSASAAEVVAFLGNMPAADGPVTRLSWLSSMDVNGLLIDGVVIHTQGELHSRNRLALLTPDEKGTWKIDFDAFARTVKPSWREIVASTSTQGLVRVMVAPDSYYNGPFRDESEWTCYGLASPDESTILLGYCRKKSPQAAAMARIIADGESLEKNRAVNRATLEIRRVEGAESRQFEITRVLAEDWVLSAKAFDGTAK
jgi:hypothetical protein